MRRCVQQGCKRKLECTRKEIISSRQSIWIDPRYAGRAMRKWPICKNSQVSHEPRKQDRSIQSGDSRSSRLCVRRSRWESNGVWTCAEDAISVQHVHDFDDTWSLFMAATSPSITSQFRFVQETNTVACGVAHGGGFRGRHEHHRRLWRASTDRFQHVMSWRSPPSWTAIALHPDWSLQQSHQHRVTWPKIPAIQLTPFCALPSGDPPGHRRGHGPA